jgi:exonuclease III
MLMNIATYNILKGGSQRVHWVKMIEDHSVDLLLVQESYAHDEHLPPLQYPDARSRLVWEMVEQNGWGSAIFSRNGSVSPVTVSGFTGWVVGAEIEGASWWAGFPDSILAFSVHAPSRAEAYHKQVNKLLDEISRIASGREVVIGGDFNLTVSHFQGSERPTCKKDLAIQARLADEFGLLNCWQAANPDQPLHQTLRWTNDRSIPYHCDGIFVPKLWKDRLVTCKVLAGKEWNDLSDHNPVIACFS